MVAASQPLAVQAGVGILKEGGSAVDAAVAVNACLGVMEPTACGLGGDLFALLWDPASGRIVGLNGSGRSPLALTADRVEPDEQGTVPLRSPASWTVPGCAAAWFDLHGRYGRLAMERILQPAVEYASEGFPVSPVIAGDWERAASLLSGMPGFKDVFMPAGRPPREGEIFKNPALARTLGQIAREGRASVETGSIARELVAFSGANGGHFSEEDFERHASSWDSPLSSGYRGYDLWEMPPNSQGLAALQMLNILEEFDLRGWGRASPDFWHVLIEAKKLAYADRARHYADPAFARVPVSRLISKEYARERAARISMERASMEDLPRDEPALGRKETTYLCAADEKGMMVSLIQSNYTGFGSGHVVPSLGFGIQNRGALFSLLAHHPNRLEPGKRPFHTIIPALLTREGRPLMVFGVMGGDMQPQGHAQVLVNLIDLGMNLQEAGDAPRFRHTGSSEPTGTVMIDGGTVQVEAGVDSLVLRELERRGHRLCPPAPSVFGGYQAIWRDPRTGAYAGATEMRKDGCALGY